MNNYHEAETILSVRNLNHSIGDNKILQNLSFEVKNIVRPDMEQGQVVCLLGPSGVGKSQLFSLLSGLQSSESGEILYSEQQIPIKRGVFGLVDQHYTLFDSRTVIGNLLEAATYSGMKKQDALNKSRELLEHFGIADKENSYPDELSGGQKQRVAIIKQLLCSKYFLLMDEPFSGLDPRAKKQAVKLILDVSKLHELNTMIVSTHDIPTAVKIADTIIIMGYNYDKNGINQGSNIKHTYNLADMGLAWENEVEEKPEYHDLVKQIINDFDNL